MKYIVAFIGLLLINQLQAQEENWQNYIATFENKPGSVIVDMQLTTLIFFIQMNIMKSS
ncbi:DUF695 domain-containing protein [Flavihumibacter cheonanensis]|uniref:DUF695 domain-containing protein n=1 Tax=Flavihumibacter cheonanensis TaxID=1442385 RepID=UPI001EF80095|nr:DUF695 domain-containing protein [Flavihumibacter cheonanensis]MCG7751323.1 DUF695 domain-containing protein [Flavihumibacter cheonanensis]